MSKPAILTDRLSINGVRCICSLAVMNKALHVYIDNEVKKLHGYMTQQVFCMYPSGCPTGNQCGSCSSKDIKLKRGTWNINCKNKICDKWLHQILVIHDDPHNPTINWKNADISKWPTDCYEFAKVFMPKGQNKAQNMPMGLDAPAILSLMKYCTWFKARLPNTRILSDLIDIRNKLQHSADMRVADTDKDNWIDLMIQLLNDLNIHGDAQTELQKLKNYSDDAVLERYGPLYWRLIVPGSLVVVGIGSAYQFGPNLIQIVRLQDRPSFQDENTSNIGGEHLTKPAESDVPNAHARPGQGVSTSNIVGEHLTKPAESDVPNAHARPGQGVSTSNIVGEHLTKPAESDVPNAHARPGQGVSTSNIVGEHLTKPAESDVPNAHARPGQGVSTSNIVGEHLTKPAESDVPNAHARPGQGVSTSNIVGEHLTKPAESDVPNAHARPGQGVSTSNIVGEHLTKPAESDVPNAHARPGQGVSTSNIVGEHLTKPDGFHKLFNTTSHVSGSPYLNTTLSTGGIHEKIFCSNNFMPDKSRLWLANGACGNMKLNLEMCLPNESLSTRGIRQALSCTNITKETAATVPTESSAWSNFLITMKERFMFVLATLLSILLPTLLVALLVTLLAILAMIFFIYIGKRMRHRELRFQTIGCALMMSVLMHGIIYYICSYYKVSQNM